MRRQKINQTRMAYLRAIGKFQRSDIPFPNSDVIPWSPKEERIDGERVERIQAICGLLSTRPQGMTAVEIVDHLSIGMPQVIGMLSSLVFQKKVEKIQGASSNDHRIFKLREKNPE